MRTELLTYLRSVDKSIDRISDYAADAIGSLEKLQDKVSHLGELLGNFATVPDDLKELLRETKALRLEMLHQMENADDHGSRLKALEENGKRQQTQK